MTFTDEQSTAIITHDRNLIVTAGAGSGKTRVLVERFMALLDRYPAWTLPSVVAITFTEKAAREMRDRVRAALDSRIRAAAEDKDDTRQSRWLDHQAALTRSRIGTIHGLCALLLRTHPAEAGIDPAFAVLDENDASMLRDDAVEEALARLAVEDRPGAALLPVYGVGEVRGVLRRFTGQGVEAQIGQHLQRSEGEWLARWQAAYDAAINDLRKQFCADPDVVAAFDTLRPADLPPSDKLADLWREVLALRPAIYAGTLTDFLAGIDWLADHINLQGGSKKAWGGDDVLKAAKQPLSLLREYARTLRGTFPPLSEWDRKSAGWLACWCDAILAACRVYDELKQARGALDFNDLETRAEALLRDHPEVAARCAAEFSHLLVDEFQDTNDAQRRIVYALAGMGDPSYSGGRLFVVGDPKQSIYGFRGADVSVFLDVRDEILSGGGHELPLSTSFRTHDRLVQACNAIFGRILKAGSGALGRYEIELGRPMTADRPSEESHACPLTVIALRKPDGEPVFRVEEMRRWEAWEIAQHAHRMVAARMPVWDRESRAYRPVDYGDMAVLFQTTTQFPLYEDVFKQAALPYVTVAGRGYYGRQEVWDLLNLLKALHNPADDLSLAATLRSPLFGLSDDALFALRLARDGTDRTLPLWEALFDAEAAPLFPPEEAEVRSFASGVLADLRDLAGRATIAELLVRALDQTGYPAVLTGLADGARRRGNVEKLVALARESGRVSLGAFLAYARDLTDREVREGEAAVEARGAVTLMTVHSSKGLEFPVVVLADASWQGRRARRETFALDPEIGAACALPMDDPDDEPPVPFALHYARWAEERRDRAERRRLLYVGATRAQDTLIVSGALDSPEHTWMRQWLTALDLVSDDLPCADEPYRLAYDWGDCALYLPFPREIVPHLEEAVSGWETVAAGHGFDGVEPILPPLLAEIPLDPLAPADTLVAATHLAGLGRAPFYSPVERGYRAFRHAVLHDAPDPVRPLPDRPAGGWTLSRTVGEIVHRALRAWLLPGTVDGETLDARLRSYAWEAGLSADEQIDAALALALPLLERFAASEVQARIARAEQVYRELPFMHRAGPRTIHGVIDVLYFDRGQWHVLDYKTAHVSWAGAPENARRYDLQIGAYAQAVEAMTGQAPRVELYYIHPARLLVIDEARWRAALDRLDDEIRRGLGAGDPHHEAQG